MNIYENIVILNASLPDEEINTSATKIQDLVVNAGGEILKTDFWGRKRLAYEIKKQNKGFFVFFVFKAPPEIVGKIERFCKVSDAVVKFMVVKLGPKQIKAFEASLPAPAEGAEKEA